MSTPMSDFAAFRQLVIADAALFDQLTAANAPDEFAALAVQLGGERGFSFTVDDVRGELQAARRAWIERNVL